MIGSVSQAAPTSSIVAMGTTIASSFFGYGGSYMVVDTISPGSGYWVRVDSAGRLVIAAGSQIQPVPASPATQLAALSTLEITDAQGKKGTLYFGENPDRSFDPEKFALPPAPPGGMFDVRFGSQRLAEVISVESSKDVPVTLTSAMYPVTISWNVRGTTLPAALVVGGNEVMLEGTGSTKVADGRSRINLRLGASAELPRSFALDQNYPNPFNPSTVIRYQLPVDSKVRLTVYNILGQELETIVDGVESAGYRSVEWHANVASGVYLYKLEAVSTTDASRSFSDVKKMVLVR